MVLRCAWGSCNSDERYPERLHGARFILFPKPKTQLAKCLRWIKACGRPHAQLNVKNINKHKAVCSKHFVGGNGPTQQYPDPLQAEWTMIRHVRLLPKKQPLPECHSENHLASPSSTHVQPLQENTDLNSYPPPVIILHRSEVTSTAAKIEEHGQQLFVCKEEYSPSMDQDEREPPHIKEDQEEPEPPHIKEEQEELWTSQEGEQLPGINECDIIAFTFNPDLVKSEYDEEEQSSQLHPTQNEENSDPLASTSPGQIKTEDDGEDCGVSEAARNCLDLAGGVEPSGEDQILSSDLKTETDDSDDWEPETKLSPSDITTLKSQKTTNTGERPFNCTICKKSFTHQSILKRHTKNHTGVRPFICSVCEKDFTYKHCLTRHMRIHTGEKPFSCTVCKKAFTWGGDLKTHMRIHSGERPFSCTVCNKYFTQQVHLKMHMGCHEEKSFSCTVCKEDFTQQNALKIHMMTHSGEQPFSCPFCKKEFVHNSDRRRHMRIHSGERPFRCTLCDKDFTQQSALKLHMRMHSGQRPFVCEVCKKDFTQQCHLKIHMRVHTGERPFGCPVCKKDFTQQSHLKIHMITHSRERLFSCSVCNKDFPQKGDVRRHMRIHTGERPFRCSICNKAFTQLAHLKTHMKYHAVESSTSV